MAALRTGTRGLPAAIQQPVTSASGIADGFRPIGGRTAVLSDGVLLAGRASLLTGSGVPAATPLIIRSQIGGDRPEAGVIRSWKPLSNLGRGFFFRHQKSSREHVPQQ